MIVVTNKSNKSSITNKSNYLLFLVFTIFLEFKKFPKLKSKIEMHAFEKTYKIQKNLEFRYLYKNLQFEISTILVKNINQDDNY